MGVGNRVVGIGLDPLDLEPEPEQPLLHDALRALFVAEQATSPDEPCGQVVQVVDPLVDGSGERGEHARIIGRRLGALPPPESRSGRAPRTPVRPVVERAAVSVERRMPNVIIFGDSRHPSLRHEVAVPLPDPIGYLEAEGSRTILAGSLDVPRLQALGDYEVVS